MAIKPSTAYALQVDVSDPVGYPHGRAQNDAVLGDGSGTPLEQQWVSDLFGFEQALLAAAGLTPSTIPDKVGASQYLDAIRNVCEVQAKLTFNKSLAVNWPERVAFGSASAVNTRLAIAYSGDIAGGIYCLLDVARTLYTSRDGVSGWLAVATIGAGTALKPELAVGKLDGVSIFLACGVNAASEFTTSPDGATWTNRSLGSLSLSTNGGCAAYSTALNRWVVVGGAYIDYATATTAGFATWTAATVPVGWASSSGGCSRLVYNGSLFVALPNASYNKCLTSPDGITWTERTLPVTGAWSGLAYGTYDGIWMASNTTTGPMVISTDGLTWTTTPSTNMYLGNDLAVLGPLWVMPTYIANGGGIVWSVDKGANWTRGPAVGNHRVATLGWRRILAADSRFSVAHVDGTNIEVALTQRIN